jgi:hypothetical protein
MTEEQFLTRRQLREAERAGTTVPVSAADVVANDETQVIQTPAASNPFLSRRQLREFEKRGVLPAENSASPVATEAQAETVEIQPPVAAAHDEVLAEAEEPITSGIQLFAVSPNLNIEPQTASIVVVPEDPLANLNLHITETGELLKTGSIELPKLSTNTGEISTIRDAAEVDEAITQDSVTGYVSTIAPLRASGVVNTSGRIAIMPNRLARGQSQIFAVLTASLLMVTVGGLLLAAYMLGLL